MSLSFSDLLKTLLTLKRNVSGPKFDHKRLFYCKVNFIRYRKTLKISLINQEAVEGQTGSN